MTPLKQLLLIAALGAASSQAQPREITGERVAEFFDAAHVTHLIFGEGYSAERLAWREAPALHRALFLLVAVASLLGAIGFVRKLFSRKTDGKPLLPALDRWAVGLACLFTLFVLYRIDSELNAPTGGFVHGVPPPVKLLLAWILLTVPLALAIGPGRPAMAPLSRHRHGANSLQFHGAHQRVVRRAAVALEPAQLLLFMNYSWSLFRNKTTGRAWPSSLSQRARAGARENAG